MAFCWREAANGNLALLSLQEAHGVAAPPFRLRVGVACTLPMDRRACLEQVDRHLFRSSPFWRHGGFVLILTLCTLVGH